MLSFKKSPFTLEFQMPRGQKVSRLLATSSKFLVANAQFLVALATSQSQCRTLFIFEQCTKYMYYSVLRQNDNLQIHATWLPESNIE